MQKRGKTATGKQRWKCLTCRTSTIRRRKDVQERHVLTQFIRWITGVHSLTEVAISLGLSRKQLTVRFQMCWETPPPQPRFEELKDQILIVDGAYLSGRTNAALIARTPEKVHSWHFAQRECFEAWNHFFSHLTEPTVIVMDGQKGLYEAVKRRFPRTRIQRCLVHVERYVRICISTRPKTEAGQMLWKLMRDIWNVGTLDESKIWCTRFYDWEKKYQTFLQEKSVSSTTGRWWYTHRKLRAARSHIKNALPYLFTFIEISCVPRTTNHVEGGVNSRLKELIKRHRGLSDFRKRVLVSYFLSSKSF